MLSIFPVNPEVISIHIPKTAGSSFHAILKSHYGWRLKHIYKHKDFHTLNTGKKFYANKPFVKAIHGHIKPHANWKKQYKNAKWVCWFRDPVERVISAYYHLEKTQGMGMKHEKRFGELKPNLEEFVRLEDFKPVTRIYQAYFNKFNPEDLFFIGRTEHFKEDLNLFAKLIGSHSFQAVSTNIGKNKIEVPESTKATLKTHLSAEYEIYTTFLNQFYPS